MKRWLVRLSATFLLMAALPLIAQDLASYEKRVTVKTLPNGLTVLIWQRPEAPVFSFFTMVDAGSAQDPRNETGLAHMMEHMAFKGTPDIGTTNYAAEKVALEKVEQAYAAYESERIKRVGQDPQKLAQLKKAWEDARKDADQYVIKNEFGKILESHGGVGVNAFTNYDETGYMYSLPSNQIQLWAALESDRMGHPVMREFYKERSVVMEERRMRTDSQPTGRLVEQFLGTAFLANPYHRPTIGFASDLESFSATDAAEFFQHYYVPSNMVIALVGDLDPAKVMPIVEQYFDQLPAEPKPVELHTIEPAQNSVRQVTLHDPSQPFYLEGYHRPSYLDKDDAVYDAISDILSNGRTSRLYRSLVRDQQISAYAAGFTGFPGSKYAHLFAFYAIPMPGHTTNELQKSFHEQIEKLKTQDVTDDELQMFKTRTKADLIRGLASNEGLAQQLAFYQTRYGDWRELFRYLDRVDKVSKADVRRVANQVFQDANRTVGVIETQTASSAPAAGAAVGKGAEQQ
ncbi:MAG TPA: pitrilysin family protein [Verrucomicrobiae bacterium]|jgi:predicted Zn-dependent peptidase|nr:pitrilysin family protein [Verrucomicrobiae bacterium]